MLDGSFFQIPEYQPIDVDSNSDSDSKNVDSIQLGKKKVRAETYNIFNESLSDDLTFIDLCLRVRHFGEIQNNSTFENHSNTNNNNIETGITLSPNISESTLIENFIFGVDESGWAKQKLEEIKRLKSDRDLKYNRVILSASSSSIFYGNSEKWEKKDDLNPFLSRWSKILKSSIEGQKRKIITKKICSQHFLCFFNEIRWIDD